MSRMVGGLTLFNPVTSPRRYGTERLTAMMAPCARNHTLRSTSIDSIKEQSR